MIDLTPEEQKLVLTMRKHKGHVLFRVQKQPTRMHPDGEFVRIVIEQSILTSDLLDTP